MEQYVGEYIEVTLVDRDGRETVINRVVEVKAFAGHLFVKRKADHIDEIEPRWWSDFLGRAE
jgi:hypothetical protein